ncbi:hypothetical protein HYPSUDRAFT_546845 [Hypholoma sublateritium FD-334 SS-4]|uniref:Uncharacterized protein n=1 Tax=Hypholoma sublateritium (strain FD-334 SS-4) TaxID=945553 RepID=A0A0D2NZ92_HYPSF|nr:hypothetical protein HYPSUDRAFT_546845 [Hypholoma sublateritium FD-334 SS-4]
MCGTDGDTDDVPTWWLQCKWNDGTEDVRAKNFRCLFPHSHYNQLFDGQPWLVTLERLAPPTGSGGAILARLAGAFADYIISLTLAWITKNNRAKHAFRQPFPARHSSFHT